MIDPQEVGRRLPDRELDRAMVLPDGGTAEPKVVGGSPSNDTAGIDDRLHLAIPVVFIGGPHHVVLDHQALGRLLPAAAPVNPPVRHHSRVGVEAAQELGQAPSRGREEELVAVDEGDPASLVAVAPQAVLVGAQLAGHERPVLDLDDSGLDLRLQLRAPAVRAAVVVQIEALHTLDAVKAHPFRQVARFVPEDGANREPNRRPRAERSRPACPDVAEPAGPIPDLAGAGTHPGPDPRNREKHRFQETTESFHATVELESPPPPRRQMLFVQSWQWPEPRHYVRCVIEAQPGPRQEVAVRLFLRTRPSAASVGSARYMRVVVRLM